jgi:hypothetical protein
MKKNLLFSILIPFIAANLYGISISEENSRKISMKIWKNECAGTIKGLTCWNAGESFASLGIGHFIWYPKGKKEGFQESFPELLTFLENQGIELPFFLKDIPCCPWNSRDDFYEKIDSFEMETLRKFLFATKDLQTIFIIQRLEKTLSFLAKNLPDNEKEHVTDIFLSLEKTPNGLYALIDYLNFKGAGVTSFESYQGKGWGLLQVLQGIPSFSTDVLADFVSSAKVVLTERVHNAPPERNEQRWLKGWINRIDTYLKED